MRKRHVTPSEPVTPDGLEHVDHCDECAAEFPAVKATLACCIDPDDGPDCA